MNTDTQPVPALMTKNQRRREKQEKVAQAIEDHKSAKKVDAKVLFSEKYTEASENFLAQVDIPEYNGQLPTYVMLLARDMVQNLLRGARSNAETNGHQKITVADVNTVGIKYFRGGKKPRQQVVNTLHRQKIPTTLGGPLHLPSTAHLLVEKEWEKLPNRSNSAQTQSSRPQLIIRSVNGECAARMLRDTNEESTMICIDNSEFMRNGDLTPTRLQCEQEAANMVTMCKLRSNPENAVGLLSMADDVKVLSTMTQEDRKLFCKLHEVEYAGTAKIVPAIKVAHLALKHRQNRNHKMRIILFIGSPVEGVEDSEFVKLAKKLKKEKVNVDIVCFGEATEESSVFESFVNTLNGQDGTGSNLIVVGGGNNLREALALSPICRADGGTGAPLVNPGAFDFGMDGEEDPELALALRVSLEEQRARQRQENGEAEPEAGGSAGGSSSVAASVAAPLSLESVDPAAMTEEEQIQLALRMSMQDVVPQAPSAPANAPSANEASEEAMEVDPPRNEDDNADKKSSEEKDETGKN
ncbi:hypothetical protein FO519_001044 [Halicephalobus sp. NKZ332]|nr:hypothetical protein FO519_001044 [Halicephalobus sp. NKZ332]